MNAEEFVKVITKELERDKQHFINNMENLGIKDKTFTEWLDILIRWMEWLK